MTEPDWVESFLDAQCLPQEYRQTILTVNTSIADRIAACVGARAGQMMVLGISGAQGSGKSTLAASLPFLLAERGLRAVVLSLDDLYLGQSQRLELARAIHPLLATRGVPGTHDVDLGLRTISALRRGEAIQLPSFDKYRDDRMPIRGGERQSDPIDVLVFEGWCIGARPQSEEALLAPINDLERTEDAHGTWRRYVNCTLGSSYQSLFAEIDQLIYFKAESLDGVYRRRVEQERKLRNRHPGSGGGLMDTTQLRRFVALFERITRHMLLDLPSRADVVLPVWAPGNAVDNVLS